MFSIIGDGSLLPTEYVEPANYEGMGTREFEDREATIDDICDFVVEYIHSDVLVRFLLVAVRFTPVDESFLRDYLQTDI